MGIGVWVVVLFRLMRDVAVVPAGAGVVVVPADVDVAVVVAAEDVGVGVLLRIVNMVVGDGGHMKGAVR